MSSEAQIEQSPTTSITRSRAKGYSVSPPCHHTNGVVRLVDFAILQSCSNLSDVLYRCIASHRANAPVFPPMASQRSGSSSLFSGDHYNSETAGASCWSTRTWQLDDNLGLRSEDTAPWSNAPRDSGRQVRVRPRQEARLASPALRRLPCNPAKEPTQASPTRLVRSALRRHAAHLPASRPALPSIAPRAASASLGTAFVLFLVLPASPEICPRAYILESRP